MLSRSIRLRRGLSSLGDSFFVCRGVGGFCVFRVVCLSFSRPFLSLICLNSVVSFFGGVAEAGFKGFSSFKV